MKQIRVRGLELLADCQRPENPREEAYDLVWAINDALAKLGWDRCPQLRWVTEDVEVEVEQLGDNPDVKVVLDEDQRYAPSAYLICKVGPDGNWDTRDEDNTVLVTLDWDFPGLAGHLGYVPCQECAGATDGTVDCAHKTAEQMITEAAAYLDAHLGEPFEDPGYFAG